MTGAMRGPAWTADELAVITQHYPDGGGRAVHRLLPHRSMSAIKNAAARMGLEYRGAKRGYKPAELAAVVVPRMDPSEIADIRLYRFDYPVTPATLRWAA